MFGKPRDLTSEGISRSTLEEVQARLTASEARRKELEQTLAELRPMRCSFCGKSQQEVRKLFGGPTAFICDECVDTCSDILREEMTAAPKERHPE